MKGLTCRMSDSTPRRALFVQGLRYGLPILLGYVPVSFAFAVTAVGSGLPWYLVLAISMTNFTSAGQAAGSGLLAAGGPLPEIGVTVFVINIRYMLMSLSLSQRLEGMSLGKRLLVANGVTDEIFFLAMQKPGNRLSGWFFTGLALGPYAGWVAFAQGAGLGLLPVGQGRCLPRPLALPPGGFHRRLVRCLPRQGGG